MSTRIFLVAVAAVQVCSVYADIAHIEALVLDEVSGEPVKDVAVCGSFMIEGNPWDYVKGHPSPNFDYGRTDSLGRCKLKGKTNCGRVSCFLESGPSAYYWRHRCGGHVFKSKNFFGVWQPDDLVVTIRLQRVEHPIPLWVKRCVLDVDKDISNLNEGKFSYDLMMGEWLPPFGNGKVADIEFARLPHEDLGEGENDGIKGSSFRDSMSVTFPGADNGLLEMRHDPLQVLRIRTAPESGYCPNYLRWEGRNEKLKWDSNYNRNKIFCFRIRTRRDEKGNIIEAYYGKVYGDFEMFKGYNYIVCGARFHYYLNPISLDRNLEWDMKNNLCPGSLVSPRP